MSRLAFLHLLIAGCGSAPPAQSADRAPVDGPAPDLLAPDLSTVDRSIAPDLTAPPDEALPPDLLAPDLMPLPDLAPPPDLMPTCSDGTRNGKESDTDCGGDTCAPCGVGRMCASGADCGTGVCTRGVCVDASCTDKVKNGSESDLDCGGACPRCGDGAACKGAFDCASGVCAAGACAMPACDDKVKNGDETDVDCGGQKCGKCALGKGCVQPGDCAGGACAGGLCVSPACNDALRNGDETDVDCGGAMCARCGTGKGCSAGADCASGVCAMTRLCAAPSCSDGVKNGSETDLDCGGACVSKCPPGKGCAVSADCAGGPCEQGSCRLAKSCRELRATQPGTLTGKREIDPDGPGGAAPFTAWCDMDVDGGGWTLVAVVAQGDAQSWKHSAPNPNLWESANTLGALDPAAGADYKSPAYATVTGRGLMLTYKNLFLLRSDESCLPDVTLRARFAALGWESGGSEDYSGHPKSTHPCVVAEAKVVVGERALSNGAIPARLHLKAGEADGAQDSNKDRCYLSTSATRPNVDYPRGLGAFNSGACGPPNCENDVGGYNNDGSGSDIAVPGSAADFYGVYVR